MSTSFKHVDTLPLKSENLFKKFALYLYGIDDTYHFCFLLLYFYCLVGQRPSHLDLLSSCIFFLDILLSSISVCLSLQPQMYLILQCWDDKKFGHNFCVHILLYFISNTSLLSIVAYRELASRDGIFNCFS